MKKQVTDQRKFTSKQMGDACEMLVAGELTLAGIPALTVPANWPGYDIVAQPPGSGSPLRISVKSRTYSKGARYIEYTHSDVFDWLALVILPGNGETQRRIFLIPRNIADKEARRNAATTKHANQRYWSIAEVSKKFAPYENNFSLLPNGKQLVSAK